MKTGIEWLKLKINNPTLPKKKKKKDMEQLEHSTLLVEMQNDSNTIVKLGSVLYPHHMY